MQPEARSRTALALFATLFAALPLSADAMQQCGKAAWYEHTGRTASGERANPNSMTAAHRTLPFGTRVTVTNRRNGRSVTVRINDRGPYGGGRVIDVTRAAARRLGMISAGVVPVRISTGGKGRGRRSGCR